MHPFFGELSRSYFAWEGTAMLYGETVPVVLVNAQEATNEELDQAADLLGRLAELDGAARTALLLDKDPLHFPLYVSHHLEELSPAALKDLFATTSVTPEQFLAAMHLHRVSVRPRDPDGFAVLDYTVGAKVTNYVMAITFDRERHVIAIAMES